MVNTAEPAVAYHGTRRLDLVLSEGLQPDSWMALDPTEAANYGDVVEIDLTQIAGTWPIIQDACDGTPGELCWQAHTNDQPIPPSALKEMRDTD